MQTSILRPGLLVSLRTSIKGNVRYFTTELEKEHITEEGEERARWETERTVRDPEEQKRALKARSLARSAVQTVCSHSDFGLLCLVRKTAPSLTPRSLRPRASPVNLTSPPKCPGSMSTRSSARSHR